MKKKTLKMIGQVILFLLGTGLLVWFCIPIFWGVFHIGNGMGICFSLLLMAGALWYVPIRNGMEQSAHARGFRILRRGLWTCFTLCMVWFAFLTACMVVPQPAPPEEPNGTVVVLGCKIGSAALNARIDRAADYLRAHPELKAVASGGFDDDLQLSEGEAMKRGLIYRGIAEHRIFVEGNSADTKQNIAFTRAVIEENGLADELVIVTEQYHEYRAVQIARRQGLSASAVPAETPWYILSASYGRELLALTKFFVFPWL